MRARQFASNGEVSARDLRLARDKAFGLYVGRVRVGTVRKEFTPAAVRGEAISRLPFKAGEGRRSHASNAPALATIAVVSLAAMAAAVLGGRVNLVANAGLPVPPAAQRAALIRNAEQPSDRARLAVAATILAEPAASTPLSVSVAGPGDTPAGGFVRVRGLPTSASLSPGHAMGPGAWAVPLDHLPRLAMKLPAGVSGTSKLTFTLVSAEGERVTEVQSALVISPPLRAKSAPPGAAAQTALEADPLRLPHRRARGELPPPAIAVVRDATPRLVPGDTQRKHAVRHIAKRNQQIATKVRKVKSVRTVEDSFSWLPST